MVPEGWSACKIAVASLAYERVDVLDDGNSRRAGDRVWKRLNGKWIACPEKAIAMRTLECVPDMRRI